MTWGPQNGPDSLSCEKQKCLQFWWRLVFWTIRKITSGLMRSFEHTARAIADGILNDTAKSGGAAGVLSDPGWGICR